MSTFIQNDFTKWGMYSTELFTTLAVDIIQSHNHSRPLYLYLPHQAVHSANGIQPLQAPEKLIKKFKHIEDERRRIYAAMVTALDDSVGKVKIGNYLIGSLLDSHCAVLSRNLFGGREKALRDTTKKRLRKNLSPFCSC